MMLTGEMGTQNKAVKTEGMRTEYAPQRDGITVH